MDNYLNLTYRKDLQILICLECGIALGRTAVYHHASKQHGVTSNQTTIETWLSSLDPPPLDTAQLHVLVKSHNSYIKELQVEDGYECLGCRKVLTREDKIRTCAKKHTPSSGYRKTKIQHLVEAGNRRSYYAVELPPDVIPQQNGDPNPNNNIWTIF